MRYPATLPAVALCAEISAGIALHPPVPFSFLVLLWMAALSAFLARRDTQTALALTLGFASCGAFLGGRAETESSSTPLRTFFIQHTHEGTVQIFGTIAGRLRADAAQSPSGVTLTVEIDTVEVDGIAHRTSGGALIGVGGELLSDQISHWRAGRRVRFPATLRRPARYLNPGVPDAEAQLARRGISLVGSVKSDRLVEVLEAGGPVAEASAAIRAAVRRSIGWSVAPWSSRSAAVVSAILIGDRAGLDAEVERRLQEAGTYHVIAISGGNIAILSGLWVLLLRSTRIGPRPAASFTIVMLVAYAAVVEGGSSVARATLMAAVYFGAQMWDQRSRPANIAALAAAALLCARPLQVVDPGFALTFGATIGILVGMSRLAERLRAPRSIRPVVALCAASLCAEIALLPVGAVVFSRVTFAGLLVNVVAIPLMTVVQIAGMAVVGMAPIAPASARAIGWVAHLAVEGLVGSAALVDVLPWLVRRLPPPSLWIVAGYYLALCAALRSRRRLASALATGACGVWIVVAPAWSFGGDQRLLRVAFLDVGQGDAAVVQFPDGRTLSVDAGGLPGASFDIGSRVVSPAFWALGVRRLDYMSITHGDDDHIGGAASVFRDFNPLEVWEGVPVPPHEPTRRLRTLVERGRAAWRTVQVRDTVSLGNASLVVRHPSPPDWERQRVRNDDSEVLEIRYGGVSFVFTGDIGREVEERIAPAFDAAPIRILKVPHHGSATSSSAAFLKALRPTVAVISAGRGNPFGHPVASVLARYQAIGAAIYRTDQDGAVLIETDGATVRIKTFTGRQLTLMTR